MSKGGIINKSRVIKIEREDFGILRAVFLSVRFYRRANELFYDGGKQSIRPLVFLRRSTIRQPVSLGSSRIFMENEADGKMITCGQKDALDKLFDAWEGVSINTDEDLSRLGDSFPEDE